MHITEYNVWYGKNNPEAEFDYVAYCPVKGLVAVSVWE